MKFNSVKEYAEWLDKQKKPTPKPKAKPTAKKEK